MVMWPSGYVGHQQATDEETAAGEDLGLESLGSMPSPRCIPVPPLGAQHRA